MAYLAGDACAKVNESMHLRGKRRFSRLRRPGRCAKMLTPAWTGALFGPRTPRQIVHMSASALHAALHPEPDFPSTQPTIRTRWP